MKLYEVKQQAVIDNYSTPQELYDALVKYSPDALRARFKEDKGLYKGEEGSGTQRALIDPTKYKRTPVYSTYSKSVVELFDQVSGMPPRLNSIIGTTDVDTATQWGDVLALFPSDNATLAYFSGDFNVVPWPGVRQFFGYNFENPVDLFQQISEAVSVFKYEKLYNMPSLEQTTASAEKFLDILDHLINDYYNNYKQLQRAAENEHSIMKLEHVMPQEGNSAKQAFIQALKPENNSAVMGTTSSVSQLPEDYEVWTNDLTIIVDEQVFVHTIEEPLEAGEDPH